MNRIIVVIGCTGVGKSRVGVDLAKRINGEIVNADSLQVYNGFPIITNLPKLEKNYSEGIAHHLFNYIPANQVYNLHTWLQHASDTVLQVPILVGGTHYYLHSLLWTTCFPDKVDQSSQSTICLNDLKDINLHEFLKSVDPIAAQKFHPNDTRRLKNLVQSYLHSNIPPSSQINSKPFMNYEPCIFWVTASNDIIDSKINSRVYEMVDQGLLDELDKLDAMVKKSPEFSSNGAIDYTRGVLQAIGFREFESYQMLKNVSKNLVEVYSEKEKCMEMMMASTRQYARKQNTWIKKICRSTQSSRADGSFCAVYPIDLSNGYSTTVMDDVNSKSVQFLSGQIIDNALETIDIGKQHDWGTTTCDVCVDKKTSAFIVVYGGDSGWKTHLRSKKHKRSLERLKTIEKIAKYKENSPKKTANAETDFQD